MSDQPTTARPDADSVVEVHRQRMAAIRTKLREALAQRGHACDEELRFVDGKPVMVFILPSTDHVYIGYGPTGGRSAYRGPEADLDYEAVAADISAYTNTLPAPDAKG